MDERRDIDVPGYPLPIDPVSGLAWWRLNMLLIAGLRGWRGYQAQRRMDSLIPVIRWLGYGAIPQEASHG